MAAAFSVRQADYQSATDAAALVMLLDAYASDPAGGGEPLSDFAKTHLVRELSARPQAYSVLAFEGEAPVGLVNCIEGFSSFACKPLVNVHDVAVLASHRGRGIAEAMLAEAERIAQGIDGPDRLRLREHIEHVEHAFKAGHVGFPWLRFGPNYRREGHCVQSHNMGFS